MCTYVHSDISKNNINSCFGIYFFLMLSNFNAFLKFSWKEIEKIKINN